MEFETIISKQCDEDLTQFWNAIDVWLNKPHVVNRRILASSRILTLEFQGTESEINDWIETTEFSSFLSSENITEKLMSSSKFFKDPNINFKNSNFSDLENSKKYLNIARLLPRNPEIYSQTIEVTIVEKDNNSITSFYKCLLNDKQSLGFKYRYKICYQSNEISIRVEKLEDESDPSLEWIKTQLFPRLIKWIDSSEMQNNFVTGSLNLVPTDKYAEVYGQLKQKYGAEIVKIWPENTDPLKFVYEDIAIATYLLLIWEKERIDLGSEERQTFLDLGCGNGLLVHILSSEGHKGLGIDLRKRKIWDLFPESTHLEVRTIIPSSESLFPNVDWLIGNHSDELTPWVPVIAARSSYKCRFFLLPCCSYEFDGKKYQRGSASRSQYSDYMFYIKKVGEECGFEIEVDKLRIPSTKRTCFIGTKRTYSKETNREEEIKRIIEERSLKVNSSKTQEENQWSSDFKPRETIEKVRNCTKVDKNIISEIVDIVSNHLLSKARIISLDGERIWNAGGQVELSELANIISIENLKSLKNECGGLQTLLRNKGHIFCVEGGKVRFRMPGVESTSNRKRRKNSKEDKKIRIKERMCWFHENHPDGCPLSDQECNFKH